VFVAGRRVGVIAQQRQQFGLFLRRIEHDIHPVEVPPVVIERVLRIGGIRPEVRILGQDRPGRVVIACHQEIVPHPILIPRLKARRDDHGKACTGQLPQPAQIAAIAHQRPNRAEGVDERRHLLGADVLILRIGFQPAGRDSLIIGPAVVAQGYGQRRRAAVVPALVLVPEAGQAHRRRQVISPLGADRRCCGQQQCQQYPPPHSCKHPFHRSSHSPRMASV